MAKPNRIWKGPLVLAAIIIVLRLVLERAGAPHAVNNVFGVVWLYFLVPIYFAFRFAEAGAEQPFKGLFESLVLYVTYTRLMIMPTYWLAYAFQWTAPRFSVAQGGVVGEGVSPIEGYLLIPMRNAIVWIVAATVLGMIIGSVSLFLLRRSRARASEA